MRKLGEQWVEDGRMRKCTFVGEYISKSIDLGPVNEDGVLPCPFCGAFPEIIQPEDGLSGYGCHCPKCKRAISGIHGNLQGVRDAWNQREGV